MVNRSRHPSKEIEAAIQYAEENGWRYRKVGKSSHAWGRLLCPLEDRAGCGFSVWSTPRDVDIHAEQIRRRIDACAHGQEESTK